MKWFMLNFFMFISFQSSCIKSQQQYSPNQAFNCTNESLYTCNGQHPSCTSFLIFKSQPPYNSITTIALLMSSTPYELALINVVSETTVFPSDKDIIIPVNCSCSHQYYQANTTYHIEPQSLTYFVVANTTFQGLSTCGSMKHANPYNEFELKHGFELKVPLRCACPTKHQILSGTKYLLTYRLSFGDTLDLVASKFNITPKSVLTANGIKESNTLYAFTTLLIPLPDKPSISQTVIQAYKPTPPLSSKRSKAKKSIKVGVAAVLCSLLVFIVVVVTVFGVIYMKRKRKNEEMIEDEILPADLLAKIARFERVIKVYSFKELQVATENFDHKCWIKGSVYWGVFGNKILAVKKMGIDVYKQVNMLSKINHINLVKLYGFCKHQDSWYLVFEYMKIGSLREWLKETHSLCKRVQIAIDVANGLRYLHDFTKPGYVHNNLNTSNILLDGDIRAKISNFSLARMIDDGNDNSVLTRVVGTRGYMAPEYVGNGLITSKVDVYSFGVVLLELITGKDAVFRHGGQEVLLSTAVGAIMEGENAERELWGWIDLGYEANGSMDHAVQVVKLSMKCLKQDPESRPSMDEIVSSLVKIQVDLQNVAGCT
ncbi:hypothetical protein L1987_23200 [Smallanthus sonchifolius]|uniref:Uncharacterized protein n=1 Tax=Smallanthus sonchifolius TaxID=185202 RepID=A0ACB9IIQ9_9ASTR|nr:hypothetical protein L1987_23200 [Smallanthus sonchifolius]